MKKWLFTVLALLPLLLHAQQVIFSEERNDENEGLGFEVIGKMNQHVLVYMQMRNNHYIAVFDNQMKRVDEYPLPFIPDKTFNVDVIASPSRFLLIYQYNRGNMVFCYGAAMDGDGRLLNGPVPLDSTRVGVFGNRKIYGAVFSENKEHILVYKMQRKKDELEMTAKMYTSSFDLNWDKNYRFGYRNKLDIYGEVAADNTGKLLMVHQRRSNASGSVAEVNMLLGTGNEDTLRLVNIPLDGKFIDEAQLKVDNLNGRYLINSLYSSASGGNIRGLFSAAANAASFEVTATAFNAFPDSLRNIWGNNRTAFNNLYLRNLILKKDGGFVLNLEDFYMESSRNFYRNRYDYLYPYHPGTDYYMYSPSYYGYYRPLHYRNNSVRYYYDNILVMDLGRDFKVNWTHLIIKRQQDMDTDNYLSFYNRITGNALHYYYLNTERRTPLVANYSISGYGEVERNATLRGTEGQYRFMPKLARQISSSEVIIPCSFRGYVVFAKVSF